MSSHRIPQLEGGINQVRAHKCRIISARAARDYPDWKDFIDIDWSNATIVYPVPKNAISIRLDQDVVDFFRATGKGYQTRINAVLRHFMEETRRTGRPADGRRQSRRPAGPVC